MPIDQRHNRRSSLAALATLLLAAAGCESSGGNSRLQEAFWLDPHKNDAAVEEQHRESYASSRNRADLFWLLANRVESGMTQREVDGVLGEEGRRDPSGQWAKGADFRVDDDVYGYGPANDGTTVYLVFREGRLINHEPESFRPKKSREW